MKTFLIGASLIAFAAPAFAGTLQELTTKGMVMTVDGVGDIPVTYTPDGKFSADFQGTAITGTWRIDGDKLCTTSNAQPEESCVVYPKDKKSGDTFQVTSDAGTATIKIK
jgi:hypothetical protein